MNKCNYCDFLSFAGDNTMIEKYVDCLCNEISIYGSMYGKNSLKERRTVTSVFFGGGTPSLLTSALLDKIMDTLTSDVFNYCPGYRASG